MIPFEVSAIILVALVLIGVVVAVKGVQLSSDLPLFGGTAVAAVSVAVLTWLSLSHFLPAPPQTIFDGTNKSSWNTKPGGLTRDPVSGTEWVNVGPYHYANEWKKSP
jgi:hypothetical protein